jgi:large subunit ribosomal protein L15
MQIHEIKPIHKSKARKRVGRGGKRGTYSGRGIKGQMARPGTKYNPAIRSLIKRYPKLRGYRFKSLSNKMAVVNLDALEKNFKAGDIVNPKALAEKRLVRRVEGRIPEIKILAAGKLVKALTFEGCKVSQKAKEAIEKAKGTVK